MEQILSHLRAYTQGYVWQREAFNLHVSCDSKQTPRKPKLEYQILTGSVQFEDNIEDEWFIVWLLLDITRNFPLSVRVWDNDGEFILIEAAYFLPRYLKPDIATNRSWLHAGCLHIIPPTLLPDGNVRGAPSEGGAQQVSVTTALETLHRYPEVTQREGHDPFVKAISKRIEGYPEKAKQLMHRAQIWVPFKVAQLLSVAPQTVAPAVSAFYVRDPSDVRIASKMKYFPPNDMVLMSVTFNRCLYAQIALQDFSPHKEWPEANPSSIHDGARVLGAKLCTGFEILMARRDCSSPPYGAAWVNDIVEQHCECINNVYGTNFTANANADVLPNDSEDWLYGANAREIDNEIERREQELLAGAQGSEESKSDFDPEKLSSKFKNFLGIVDSVSSDGMVNVSEKELVMQLQQALGIFPKDILDERPEENESSEGSSFYALGSDDDDGDENGGFQWADASTATDSDDEYALQMREELSTTTLAHTFTKANVEKGELDPAKAESSNVVSAGQLDPVDVDFNLVDSLLASHREQRGVAGPASSLAGLLEIHLPPQD